MLEGFLLGAVSRVLFGLGVKGYVNKSTCLLLGSCLFRAVGSVRQAAIMESRIQAITTLVETTCGTPLGGDIEDDGVFCSDCYSYPISSCCSYYPGPPFHSLKC